MLKTYKVVSAKVVFDGVPFAKGDLIEVNPDLQDISALIDAGKVEEVDAEEEAKNAEEASRLEAGAVAAATPKVVTGGPAFFHGRKIVGKVMSILVEGKKYVTFTTDEGAGYKIPEEEFKQKGPVLTYQGRKVVNPVVVSVEEGVTYKSFKNDNGESFKLTNEEFVAGVR